MQSASMRVYVRVHICVVCVFVHSYTFAQRTYIYLSLPLSVQNYACVHMRSVCVCVCSE